MIGKYYLLNKLYNDPDIMSSPINIIESNKNYEPEMRITLEDAYEIKTNEIIRILKVYISSIPKATGKDMLNIIEQLEQIKYNLNENKKLYCNKLKDMPWHMALNIILEIRKEEAEFFNVYTPPVFNSQLRKAWRL
ncbi:MAG: hypothetical protein K0S55_1254 [Clostridia bacterium]|nr:hypothetical protein [Clostridia bacterium]